MQIWHFILLNIFLSIFLFNNKGNGFYFILSHLVALCTLFCVVLVSAKYWPHKISWELIISEEFFEEIIDSESSGNFTEFTTEASWVWAFVCEYLLFNNSE